MLYRVFVMTPWGGLGTREDTYFPAVVRDYPCAALDYVNGAVPPETNLTVWLISCDLATLEAIDADPNYLILSTYGGSRYKALDEKPAQAEFGLLRAFLAQKGVEVAIVDERIPLGSEAVMLRSEILNKMKSMCLDFKKAG